MRPILSCLLTLAAIPGLAAVDAPRTVTQLAESEHAWIASLAGVHATYRLTEPVANPDIARRFPALGLTYAATTESWIDAAQGRYRYETRIDADALAAAAKRVSDAVGAPVEAKRLMVFVVDEILVRSRQRSEHLDLVDGRLTVRWVPTSPGDVPELHVEANAQPLLRTLIAHALTRDGIDINGARRNPLAAAPTLADLAITDEAATAVDADHATLAFRASFPRSADPGEDVAYTLNLARHGGAAGRWFVERITARQASEPEPAVTSVVWQDLPGAPCVALPQRYERVYNGTVRESAVATTLEVLKSFPETTWSIEPLLAKTMYDETADMEILPAP